MASKQLKDGNLITVNRDELYNIVTAAVYDAFSRMDFLTVDEFESRKNALAELERGEAILWNDYLKERGINS